MEVGLCFSSPITNIYFMSHVSQRWLSASILITTVLMAIGQSAMSNENLRNKLHKFLMYFIVADALGYAAISLTTMDAVNFRFISLAVFNVLSNTIISTLFMELVNDKFRGSELTNYRSKQKSYNLWGGVLGSLIAMFVTVSVDTAIYIEAVYFSFSCIIDNKLLSIIGKMENDV